MPQQNRQLAAILFTDIVGYTAMMQQNELQAVAVVKRYISILQQAVPAHFGTILNDYGDGSLCSFPSATQAIQCAIALQLQFRNDPVVPLRIGLHVGEIFFEGEKVLGDGVNVASRIQSLGQANTILFSKEIFDKIRNQPDFTSVSLGAFEFKNVDDPVEVFALANEGLSVPAKQSLSGKLKNVSKKKGTGKWIVSAVVVVLLVAIFFGYKKYYHEPGFVKSEKSIAILPFQIIGSTGDNIASGLVEDILIHLSKIKEFDKVISNKSSSKYKDGKMNLKEIGEELDAVYLVTGSIEVDNGKIRVRAQLIDSRNENTVWADNYTKENAQVFDLQTELATQIVAALKTQITPEEKIGLSKRYTDNIEAYKYYLTGRALWSARNRANFDSAEANFKRAIALDPQYALAYAGIADCYTYNYKGMPQTEAISIARENANIALSIDSNLSEGLTTIGFIQHNFDYQWDKAKATLQKAIALDPNNATAHLYYGNALQYSGETEHGLKETEKAAQLDPVGFASNWVLGRNYYFAKRYDDAITQIKKAQKFAPKNSDVCYWSLGLVYLAKKMNQEAMEEYDKIPPGAENAIDNVDVMKGYAYAKTGNKAKAIELVEKAIKEDPHGYPSYRVAQVYLALGDINQALNYLEESYRNHGLHMFIIKVDPVFDPIRNEPRFIALMKKMNLPQ